MEMHTKVHYKNGAGEIIDVTLPGTLAAPGLVVVDLSNVDPVEHWAVIHTGTGMSMISVVLCRECALAAAAVMASHPGWDRAEDAILNDREAFLACQAAHAYGPCYPPAEVEETCGFALRIVGHVPGQVYRQPDGVPDTVGVLAPVDMTDEELAAVTPALVEKISEVNKPWYERF
jgi:hypothetical protein